MAASFHREESDDSGGKGTGGSDRMVARSRGRSSFITMNVLVHELSSARM